MLNILPAPQELRLLGGESHIAGGAVLMLSQQLRSWAPRAAIAVEDLTGIDSTQDVVVTAELDDALPPEGYTLLVDADRLRLRAADEAGAYWAVQVLHQACAKGKVQHFECSDSPVHPVRGVMLDIARHFYGVPDIERVIDIASSYRFNQLHLHLSDDQGWRLEIEERPLLTQRASSSDMSGGSGGYLSIADYAHLQDYAIARHVVILPELDFPGHTHAALMAYPEISPDDKVREPYLGGEVGFSAVDLHSDASWNFIEDVVGSLARRTLGPRIHLGGDEALTLTRDEYVVFVERLGRVAASHGKELVMWQEAAGADLPPGSLVQFWDPRLDEKHLSSAAEDPDVKFIASPGNHTYLDHRHTPGDPYGQTWAGSIDVRQAYEWLPADVLPGVPASSIIGVEACLWTEYVTTFDRLTAQLLPRLPAIAEVAWGSPPDWDRFSIALAAHGKTWEAQGLAFHRSTQIDW